MGISPINNDYYKAAVVQSPVVSPRFAGTQSGQASPWQVPLQGQITGGSVPTITSSALLPPRGLVTPNYGKQDDFNPFQVSKTPLYTTAGFGNERVASSGTLDLMA